MAVRCRICRDWVPAIRIEPMGRVKQTDIWRFRWVKGWLVLLLIGLAGCADHELMEQDRDGTESAWPLEMIAGLAGEGGVSSRMFYEEKTDSTGRIICNTWEEGDGIAVSVQGYSGSHAVYRLTEGAGTVKGLFTREADHTDGRMSSCYGIYYPATIISDQHFFGFSYEGQIQTGNGSMDHLKDFHTIRALELHDDEDISTLTPFTGYVDFGTGEVLQSACMKFVLSGFPKMTPRRITLMKVDANGFVTNSFYATNHTDGLRWTAQPAMSTHALSLGLEGMVPTTSVEAYMMMSCMDVSLRAGDRLRIMIEDGKDTYCAEKKIASQSVLKGGKLHVLTVSGTGSWTRLDMQASTEADYEAYDGKVTCLQEATADVTVPTDLILMGDGFIGQDFADGTYHQAMQQACEDFFSVQPLKSLRDHFNVYSVNAVSENRFQIDAGANGAVATVPAVTCFNTYLVPGKTDVGGNVARIVDYAIKALTGEAEDRQSSSLILVVLNADCHAGTCIRYYDVLSGEDYGELYSIAYCTANSDREARRLTLVHEAVGHGFGKLADEYGGTTYYANPAPVWNQLELFHELGFDRNIDRYDDTITPYNVYWSALTYAYADTEGLGVHHEGGAYTVSKDFCRPTVNSVMRNQFDTDPETGYYRFNPASRWAIWYRLKRLTGTMYEDFSSSSFDFINWDSLPEHQDAVPTGRSVPRSVSGELLSSPPLTLKGRWQDGKLVEVGL